MRGNQVPNFRENFWMQGTQGAYTAQVGGCRDLIWVSFGVVRLSVATHMRDSRAPVQGGQRRRTCSTAPMVPFGISPKPQAPSPKPSALSPQP